MTKQLITGLAAGLLLALAAGTCAAGPHGAAHPPQTTGKAVGTSPTTVTDTTVRGPSRTGQPGQSCGSTSAPNTPGNAAQAPGSAFNPDGNAGTHYAGQQTQNSRNTASVAQYDSACAHQR
jgi:hypothetical protein